MQWHAQWSGKSLRGDLHSLLESFDADHKMVGLHSIWGNRLALLFSGQNDPGEEVLTMLRSRKHITNQLGVYVDPFDSRNEVSAVSFHIHGILEPVLILVLGHESVL